MRSMLFVPGDSEKKFQKAMGVGADALILDLEDSVAAEQKPEARKITAALLGAGRSVEGRPLLYVRINSLDTPYWSEDLAAVMPAKPDGIVLPKPTSGADVHRLAVALDHGEQPAGTPVGTTRILPIATEVAVSVLQMHTYVGSSSRMDALSWGAEDLSSQVGAATNRRPDGDYTSPYRLARDLCLLTAIAADAQPMDTVYVNFRDEAGLIKEAREAARDGFTGKMAIHPAQVAPINAAFTPNDDEITHAQRIIQVFADNPTSGVAALDGEMLDRPHLVRAERLIARARAAGVLG
jgi:citrate lyase subunit beta / citryl-CoA lyase